MRYSSRHVGHHAASDHDNGPRGGEHGHALHGHDMGSPTPHMRGESARVFVGNEGEMWESI
jgi:hypothetical protein